MIFTSLLTLAFAQEAERIGGVALGDIIGKDRNGKLSADPESDAAYKSEMWRRALTDSGRELTKFEESAWSSGDYTISHFTAVFPSGDKIGHATLMISKAESSSCTEGL